MRLNVVHKRPPILSDPSKNFHEPPCAYFRAGTVVINKEAALISYYSEFWIRDLTYNKKNKEWLTVTLIGLGTAGAKKINIQKSKNINVHIFPWKISPEVLLGFLFLSFKCQLRKSCHFYLLFRLAERKCQMEDKYLLAPKKLLLLYAIFLYVRFWDFK